MRMMILLKIIKILLLISFCSLYGQKQINHIIYDHIDTLVILSDSIVLNNELQNKSEIINWQKNNPIKSFSLLYRDTHKKLLHGSYLSYKGNYDIYFYYLDNKIIKIIIE